MTLTERQEQALRLAGDGLSIQEMAVALNVTPRTAKQYCDTLRVKLGGLENKRELVVAAREYFSASGVSAS